MSNINIDAPQPKQREFMGLKNRYIGFGGARGGGKSWSLRVKAILLCARYEGIKVLLIRRTYDELYENHIEPLLVMLGNNVDYNDGKKRILFPNGSVIKFGYLRNDRDILRYQGLQYDVVMIDEATQFQEEHFDIFKACLRGANDFPKRMYLTCNPGGVGHAWVKRLFVDRAFTKDECPDDYAFVRSLVYDNKILMEKDPEYERNLHTLPEKYLRAWLYGDWDIFVGQYFTMWNRDVHIIDNFVPPADWARYVSMDYGRDMFACYFVAMDGQGNAYVYKEIYKSELMASEAAELLKSYIQADENIRYFYAPPDLWNKNNHSGRSTADVFALSGIKLHKVNNDRELGWLDLAEWLRVVKDEQGEDTARLKVCRCCDNLIRTLPAVQFDPKRPNDIANEPHELTHAPDAIRYFCAGMPKPNKKQEAKKKPAFPQLFDRQDNKGGIVVV